MNCALHFGTMFHAALKVNAYFQVIFVVACVMHGELSVTEIHDVKTLNSELRSNSQLSACILYGTSGCHRSYSMSK